MCKYINFLNKKVKFGTLLRSISKLNFKCMLGVSVWKEICLGKDTSQVFVLEKKYKLEGMLTIKKMLSGELGSGGTHL